MPTGPHPPRPPRLARAFLLRIAPARYRVAVDGDLLEGFRRRARQHGRATARRWYWRQLASLDVLRLRRVARHRAPSRIVKRETPMFHGLVTELRIAVRGLVRSPLFTIAALATLALGIGANVAIFTVVDGVVLRPLPYVDADRLVMVFRTVPRYGFDRSTVSFPDFHDWRRETRSLEGMAAYSPTRVTVRHAEGAERWQGYRVTAELLPLLGVTPALGRGLTADDDRPGADPVVVLGHGLWQRRFGASPDVVGETLRLDDTDHVVVGVQPAGFAFPTGTAEFWTPLRGDTSRMERDTNFLGVIGRLAPGRSIAEAQEEITGLAARIDAAAPGANEDFGVFVESRHAYEVGDARAALLVFAAAVAVVLLIACANVAHLLLLRAAARRREIAVRAALGGSRGRLARLLLVESGVIAMLGGALGVALGQVLLRVLLAMQTGQVPRVDALALDGRVLAFALVLSLGSGVAFGLTPLLAGAGRDLQRGLRAVGQGVGTDRRGRRLQQAFVVVQVALAMTLLVGAGLLTNSFARLTAVDVGFDPRGVVAGRVELTRPILDMSDEAAAEEAMLRWSSERDVFMDALLRSASDLPGVEAAGLAYGLPLAAHSFSRTAFPEGTSYAPNEEPVLSGNIITAGYLETMAIPLRRGRGFTDRDRADSAPVMLVDETAAGLLWPDTDPVGKRIRLGDAGDGPWITVVGLVADIRAAGVAQPTEPTYYRPLAQVRWPDAAYVAVRTRTPVDRTVAGLREVVSSLDAGLPLTEVTTAAGLIDRDVAAPRFRTLVLAVFGGLATLLALVGVYGVSSMAINARRREIGVRVALGADPRDIVWMLLAGGVGVSGLGVLTGLGGALAAGRLLDGMLYGLTPYDPTTYATVAAMVLAITALACYVPARRAAAGSPSESLRAD